MTLLCIRGCTIRGHHLTACSWGQLADELARRGTDNATVAAVTAEWVTTRGGVPRECRGCLPRPAETGMLCRSCWEKFEDALGRAADLIPHLRSIERGPADLTAVRSAPGSRVILPPSWMEADNLWILLAGVAVAHAKEKRSAEPWWPSFTSIWYGLSSAASIDDVRSAVRDLADWVAAAPEDVVARPGAAAAAVAYYRGVQRALAMFPMEERERRLPIIRCRACGLDTLFQRPPLEHLDPIVIVCANEACKSEWDPQMATFDLRVYAEAVSREYPDRVADLDREVRSALKPRPEDDVAPVCASCAEDLDEVVRRAWSPDEAPLESCSLCGAISTARLYVRVPAKEAA